MNLFLSSGLGGDSSGFLLDEDVFLGCMNGVSVPATVGAVVVIAEEEFDGAGRMAGRNSRFAVVAEVSVWPDVCWPVVLTHASTRA